MKNCLPLLFALTTATALYAAPREEKNISYYDGNDPYATERCKLDVLAPDNASDAPMVVWFHGGGLQEEARRYRGAFVMPDMWS